MAGRLTTPMRPSATGSMRGRLLGRVLVTAALALPVAYGSLAFGSLAFGAQDTGSSGAAVSGDRPAPQTRLGQTEAASVENHIATLHRRLQITPAQEPLWQALAGAMRESVVQLDRVYAERKQAYGSMSAVDDLKSYGLVQQVHARNVQSLIEPFQRLYDSFSAAQKKAADETFRNFTGSAVRSPR